MPNSLSMLVEVLPLTVCTGVMMSSALAQSPASRVEFTTKETASVTDERSGVTKSQSRTFARRKDGSVREEIAAYDGKPKPVFARNITLVLPAERKAIVAHPEVGSISTFPLGPEEASRYQTRLDLDPVCASKKGNDEFAGVTTFLGQRVAIYRYQDAQGSRETYLAPGLECYSLREVATRLDAAGKVTGRYRREVTSLQLGAPDGELFAEYFEGLAERPPSEVQERLRKLAFPGEPVGDCIERTKQLMDKKYKAARSTK